MTKIDRIISQFPAEILPEVNLARIRRPRNPRHEIITDESIERAIKGFPVGQVPKLIYISKQAAGKLRYAANKAKRKAKK